MRDRRDLNGNASDCSRQVSTFYGMFQCKPTLDRETERKRQRTPEMKKVKIAVVGQGWSTIIGPPTSLNIVLQQCIAIKTLPKRDLRLRAPFHILTLSDTEIPDLLGASPLLDLPAGDVPWRVVVRLACEHVLTRPYDLAEAVKDLDHRLGPVKNIDLYVIGPSSHANSIVNQLGACGKAVTMRQEDTTLPSSQDSISDHLGKIAVVGIGGHSPGADNLEDFWTINLTGRDLHKRVPEDRFDLQEFYSPTHDGICTTNAQYGCFVDRPGAFDARFFNISHREALLMEPCHRLWLMSVYEALESAGYSQNRTRTADPNRIGTFFGQSVSDWRATTHPRGCNSSDLQGVQRAFGPGRVNYHFKWEGPSYNIDSACASSASAITLACQNLLLGEIDMAVAGGANVISSPHAFCELSRAGVLSATSNCKTFRDDADGYCRGEFSGAVILKRVEDAIAANDNILAVIASSGRNSSGNASSITNSDAGAQQRLFRRVMGKAHVAPEDVAYVEMHGTGTPVGDLAEMRAVVNTFGRTRGDEHSMRVGALKANLGHSEGAAGVASLLKCTLALQKELLPPVANMPHRLNHEYPDLEKFKVEIPSQSVEFKASKDKRRRMVLNNFDAAGGNSCMLIEDFPREASKSADPRTCHVITISAKTAASHQQNKKRLLGMLQSNSEDYRIEDLAYTTTARRIHYPYRTAIPASSVQQLVDKLDADVKNEVKTVRATAQPVVFMFTGQGSQYGGMGAALYRTNTTFRETLELCLTVCNQHELPEFLDIITDPSLDVSAKTTIQTQLAVVCLEIALSTFWQSIGIEPSMVMGHSLGEYAAFYVAGVLSLADVLLLVGRCAQLVHERCEEYTRSMLSVAASPDRVTEYANRQPSCEIACLNSPRATVVSGTLQAIQSLQAELERDGIRSQRLQVPYAFHSNQIDGILGDFATLARSVAFCAPKMPIASTLSATVIDRADIVNEVYLVRHTREKVNFSGALAAVAERLENPAFLEIGPKRVLGSFVQAIVSTVTTGKIIPTLEAVNEDWTSICKALASLYNAGIAVDWTAFHEPYTKHVNLIPMPSYSWDLNDYWLKWTEPRGGRAVTTTAEKSESEIAKPISSILHFLERQSLSPKLEFTFRSSAADPYLKALVTGHRFLTVPCCPGGVYCAIGMEAAKYALQVSGKKLSDLTVMGAAFHRPFTMPKGESMSEVITTITMPKDDVLLASFAIRTASSTTSIGDCEFKFVDNVALQTQWDSTSYFIKARMDLAIKTAKDGEGHRLRGSVFYTLFSRCLDYDEAYKGIKEAYVSEDFREAAAEVVLREDPSRSSSSSVYWTESLIHLAGFVANANPAHPVGSSFITNGFKAIEQTMELRPGGTYYSYVRVAKSDDESLSCDIFVFDSDDQLIMQCSGLAFRKVDNVSLERALGKVNGVLAAGAKATTASVPRASALNGTAIASMSRRVPIESTRSHRSNRVSVVDTLLASIATETGTDVTELTDDAVFSELGVDSIMAMQIVAAVKKATGSDVPSAFVFEHPTVGSIRKELASVQGLVGDVVENTDEEPMERSARPLAHGTPNPSASMLKCLIQSISDETGTELHDLTDDALLSELGCDSVMALQIASTVKKETDRELPGSFVLENPSIGHIRQTFGGDAVVPRPKIISTPHTTDDRREDAQPLQVNGFHAGHNPTLLESSPVPVKVSAAAVVKSLESASPLLQDTSNVHYNGVIDKDPALMDFTDVPEAKLILMQGRSSSKETPLFLMSDGFGTPASYIHLPRFKSGLPVYAIESAFLRCPGKLPAKAGIAAIAIFAVDAMIKARPQGPYLLGGFSGGATIAYEMCRQLAASGRKLQGLVLIDMCCPREMDESTDLMAKNGLPLVQRLLPPTQPSAMTSNHRAKFGPIHLRQVVRAVCHYDPPPLAHEDRPGLSCIIWARKGLIDRAKQDSQALAIMADMGLKTEASPGFMTDVSLGPAAWSVPNKTGVDLGPNGWDKFLGDGIKVLVADADHMSMPVPPDVSYLKIVFLCIFLDRLANFSYRSASYIAA